MLDFEMNMHSAGTIKKSFTFRAYGTLNDFIPAGLKQKTFSLAFKTPITVGEVAESIGIPLSEIKLVLVNSETVDYSKRLKENDFISLYPAFEQINISPVSGAMGRDKEFPSFILDAHLGKLAKYLRMLGFDTLYQNNYIDRQIIDIAADEGRMILTRDKILLKSKEAQQGYYVRAIEKHEQLKEIVGKFGLAGKFRSFTRCMMCNAEMEKKSKVEVLDKIDAGTARIFSEFLYCPGCDKVFWKGSHFERKEKLILSLLGL
jgi:uncharacterized protein with PIN domain